MIKILSTMMVLPFVLLACDGQQSSSEASKEVVKSEPVVTQDDVAVKPTETTETLEPVTKKVVEAPAVEKPVTEQPVIAKPAVATKVPEPMVAAAMNGEQVYKKSCLACHGSGAAGAPKLGDSAAWKTRLDKGKPALYASAIKGVPGTAMMAKGTCGACSDKELEAAVDYMLSRLP